MKRLDSGFRRNDGEEAFFDFLRMHQILWSKVSNHLKLLGLRAGE
jgi:hypothetical protein